MDRDRQTLCPHIQTDSFGGLSELTKLIVARNINGLASLFDNVSLITSKPDELN